MQQLTNQVTTQPHQQQWQQPWINNLRCQTFPWWWCLATPGCQHVVGLNPETAISRQSIHTIGRAGALFPNMC